jgi:hypothetical protein
VRIKGTVVNAIERFSADGKYLKAMVIWLVYDSVSDCSLIIPFTAYQMP